MNRDIIFLTAMAAMAGVVEKPVSKVKNMDKPAHVPTALWEKFGSTAEYINDKVTPLRSVARCQDLGKYVVVEFPQSEPFNMPARIYWALVPRRERTK